MNRYYATLCIGDGGGYVTVFARTMAEARQKMFDSKYGVNWAFMYSEDQKTDAIDQFDEQEVDQVS